MFSPCSDPFLSSPFRVVSLSLQVLSESSPSPLQGLEPAEPGGARRAGRWWGAVSVHKQQRSKLLSLLL